MLVVGTGDKNQLLLERLPQRYLLVASPDLIRQIERPRSWLEISRAPKITVLNLKRHTFNPLENIDYPRARRFITILDAVFPEGQNTLTKKTSNFILLRELLNNPTTLEALIPPPTKRSDNGHIDAHQKIQTLFLSPVLKGFLGEKTTLRLDGTVLAGLDPAELGDFDCYVIGNLLMAAYDGPIICPDFGFYAAPFHSQIIRQGRLTAGLNFLDEVPPALKNLLVLQEAYGVHCTAEDAKLLATYAGLIPDPRREENPYNRFIREAMA